VSISFGLQPDFFWKSLDKEKTHLLAGL